MFHYHNYLFIYSFCHSALYSACCFKPWYFLFFSHFERQLFWFVEEKGTLTHLLRLVRLNVRKKFHTGDRYRRSREPDQPTKKQTDIQIVKSNTRNGSSLEMIILLLLLIIISSINYYSLWLLLYCITTFINPPKQRHKRFDRTPCWLAIHPTRTKIKKRKCLRGEVHAAARRLLESRRNISSNPNRRRILSTMRQKPKVPVKILEESLQP